MVVVKEQKILADAYAEAVTETLEQSDETYVSEIKLSEILEVMCGGHI